MEAWLSARFGRDRGGEGLGRIPAIANAGGEEDFFTELLVKAPDRTLDLIEKTAAFLKFHRTAGTMHRPVDASALMNLARSVEDIVAWYNRCGVVEPTTGELVEDLQRVATLAREAAAEPLTGRRIAELLFHVAPQACKKDDIAFKQWGRKGKWKDAAKAVGRSAAQGDQLSAAGEALYQACGASYQTFCADIGALAFQRFVAEFDALRDLYADYKRNAALLDFDDLLHHARDLLKENEAVRQALARRYPQILVDEFQDTDPLQAEILWRLAGEGDASAAWQERSIRPGALFLVGDPKRDLPVSRCRRGNISHRQVRARRPGLECRGGDHRELPFPAWCSDFRQCVFFVDVGQRSGPTRISRHWRQSGRKRRDLASLLLRSQSVISSEMPKAVLSLISCAGRRRRSLPTSYGSSSAPTRYGTRNCNHSGRRQPGTSRCWRRPGQASGFMNVHWRPAKSR